MSLKFRVIWKICFSDQTSSKRDAAERAPSKLAALPLDTDGVVGGDGIGARTHAVVKTLNASNWSCEILEASVRCLVRVVRNRAVDLLDFDVPVVVRNP